MLSKVLKVIIDLIDLHIAHQVPSRLGYGHQIDSSKGLDDNSNFIIDTISQQNKPLSIIELASGRGALATEIIKISHVKSYLACDIDNSGLEILIKRLNNNPNGFKLSILNLDIFNASFDDDKTFDIVIADKFLHLLTPEEIEKVFKFSYQILKSGGLFIISSASNTNFVFKRTEPTEIHAQYRKLKDDLLTKLWYNISKPYVFFISKQYIQEMADSTGFIYSKEAVFYNTEDYLTLSLCKK